MAPVVCDKTRRVMMTGLWIAVLVALLMPTVWTSPALGADESLPPRELSVAATAKGGAAERPDSLQKAVYRLEFSDYPGGSVEEWLESKGFKFEEDAKDRDELQLSIHNGALILEAKEQLRGFLFKDDLEIKKFSKVRIKWGAIKYPEGASYEGKVRNEALMVYMFFGKEKKPSGHFALPDLPYFIGFFLCQHDKMNTPYLGAYYHEGGRFVCLGNPPPHQTIVSEFDLVTAFQQFFEKTEVPAISGISLGVDTSSSDGGGTAAAYLHEIEVLE
jgi:hypothetical protein